MTETKEMPRRTYVKYLAAVVAGAVVGVAGYAGYESTVPKPTVTETVTQTVTGTPTPTPTPTPGWAGITLVSVTQTGPFIAGPLFEHGPEWGAMTGAKIQVVEVPWSDLYAKIMTALTTGTKAFDILVHGGQNSPDYSPYTVELTSRIKDPKTDPWWDDIMPGSRERISGWAGKYWCLPLDGDHHMTYYNKLAMENPDHRDKFKKQFGYELPAPPKGKPLFRTFTWEEWRDMAKLFNNWDWAGDGKKHYGVMECCARGTQAHWWMYDHTAPYMVLPGGPDKYHGVLYFDYDTMDSLMGTPGAIEGVKLAAEMPKYGPPGMLSYSVGEVRSGMVHGEAAIAIDWPDIGVMSIDPKLSTIVGQCGFGQLPGAAKVYDREKGDWVSVTWAPDEKDHTGAQINQWPINNGTGWAFHIVKTAKSVEAAYDFGRFLCSPPVSLRDVVRGSTGFNPYRFSHFAPENMRAWTGAGFTEDDAKAYQEEILKDFGKVDPVTKKGAAIPDLKLPGTAQYNEVLDLHYTSAVSGAESPEDACAAIAKEWDAITDRLGRDTQTKAYHEMLATLA